MKNIYGFLFVAFLSFSVNAQIVSIPDSNFKNKLLNYSPVIDTNNDEEIQVSEALAVTNLEISGAGVGSAITDMAGIESFTNLISLKITFVSVSSLDLSTLINLKYFFFFYNYYTPTLDLSALVSLEEINFAGNSFSSFNFSALPNLKKLDYDEANTTSLDVSALVNLTDLTLKNCNLNTLDVSTLTNLIKFKCTYCGLSTINVSNLTNLTDFNCSFNSLSTLDASNLTNLTNLNCSSNSLNTLDVSNLINLKSLNCSSNLLTTVNVLNLTNLLDLNTSKNINFTSLDVSNLTNLRTLNCSENNLNLLDVSTLTSLTALICSKNQLSALNISNLINLTKLSVGFNQLTSLDFTNLTKLRYVSVGNNLFTSIDLSTIVPSPPYSLNQSYLNVEHTCSVANNPNLVYLNIKNGVPIGRINGLGGAGHSTLDITGCPNLRYLCADDVTIPLVEDLLPITQINSYCSFNPGGTYNNISGSQTFDSNNNGCDSLDTLSPLMKVTINDGTLSGAAFTNSLGNYSFFTQAGSFVLTPEFENPYFTISPPSATITFADSNNNAQTQNFCITPNGIHNDVEIAILPIQRARPGFDATYQLVYKNKGNQVLSGNVNFIFDDAVLDFVTANPATTNQTANVLNWSYTNLLPFESRTIDFTLNVNSPMEVPSVELGTILNFTASIDPVSGDETPADNIFSLSQTVVGSFDPNDKTCLEGNTISPQMVGKYLHYLIRFQNEGTFMAENVVIKDIIDTTKLDMASLQLTSSSHPQVTKITGNKVEFQFQGINLPAEIDDAPGSNGYVAFKIKTKNNLVIGDSVSNKADIFFDYNFPIETNTATSTVALLGVNTFENTSVNVTPNPTKNIVHITSKGNITLAQLFDVQGRILQTLTTNEEQVDFDLSQKSNGVYFLKIYTVKGVKVEKVIKE